MTRRRPLLSIILVLVVVVMMIVFSVEAFTDPPPTTIPAPAPTPATTAAPRLFVSVASYRDHSCGTTITDMFAKAKYPDRIFAGICEQNTGDVKESCSAPEFRHRRQIRVISIPHTEAKGPTYARYLCSTLYRNEDYFLQIDSHTVFVQDWDEKLIADHAATPRPEMSILTGYPHDSGTYKLDEQSVPLLCDSKFGDAGVPMLLSGVKSKAQIDAAGGNHFPVPFTSGGFLFGPGKMLRDVPYDPNLPSLFQGEEILYSARLWTHGYDFYSPRLNVAYHRYGRKGEARWHEDNPGWHEQLQASVKRLKQLLRIDAPHLTTDTYGLGTAREVDAYWAYAGLDWKARVSTSKSKFC